MPDEPDSSSVAHTRDAPLTPMQEAIRDRALATLENADRQPTPSRKRKIVTGLLALAVVLSLFAVIDFLVGLFQRVLSVYYQDEATTAPVAADPKQPYYITVDPGQPVATGTDVPASSSAPGTAAE